MGSLPRYVKRYQTLDDSSQGAVAPNAKMRLGERPRSVEDAPLEEVRLRF